MKRGQSATEYLVTYGWALIAIFIAIGAVMYFNVLDFNRFVPDKCQLIAGIDCVNYKVTNSNITLVIRNGMGYVLSPFNITVQSEEGCSNVLSAASSGLNDGEEEKLTFTCSPAITGAVGTKYRSVLKISYTGTSGSSHTSYGKLEAEIER